MMARVSGMMLALSSLASAQGLDAGRLLDSLPANADAAVVVRDAARLRTTPAGKALAGIALESGSLVRTRRAWSGLARSLGWSDSQAFDEILGTRMTVVVRDPRGESPQWALLTEVTPQTERRLRQRLAAVPRGNIAGLAVLGVEDGAYEIVVGPGRAVDTPRGDRQVVTLLLGPRQSTLVDDLAPALHTGLAGLAGAGSADITAAIREVGPNHEPRDFTITARSTASGWSASVIASPELVGAIGETQGAGGTPRSWSDASFQKLERGSLIAVMGTSDARLPVGWALRLSGIDSLELLPSLPASSAGAVERTALVVRNIGPISDHSAVLMAWSPGHGTSEMRAGTPGPDAPTRLSLTYAVRTRDSRAMILDGDKTVASCIAAMQSGRSPGETSAIEMTVPEVPARGLALSDVLGQRPEVLDRLGESFGPEPTLRWGICTAGGLWGVHTMPGPAWWSATLAPAGEGAADQIAATLAVDESGSPKHRVSTGMLRPAALLRGAGPLAAEFLAPFEPLAGIEQLRWDAWLRTDGMLQCDITVRVLQP